MSPLGSELPLELHHPAEAEEAYRVRLAFARVEHADAVDGGAKATTEVLAAGANTQVVVSARPPRFWDDPEFACARLRHHRRVRCTLLRERSIVGVELVEDAAEASEILVT